MLTFLFILVLDYVLRISLDSNNNLGLLLSSRQGSRRPAQYLTDLDFADDLALIAESIKNAETLLQSLEEAAAAVKLLCNETKTEFISTSISSDTIHSLSGVPIKQVEDFHIMESKKDFKSRKGMAWTACNKLDTIWNSNLGSSIPNSIKVSLFQATIEKILMYGSETWTLTSKQQQIN